MDVNVGGVYCDDGGVFIILKNAFRRVCVRNGGLIGMRVGARAYLTQWCKGISPRFHLS